MTTERKSYSSNKFQLELPYLIEVQKASYEQFLQKEISPEKRLKVGLERVFQDIFPITDVKGLYSLNYEGYYFGIPKYSIPECRERGLTYSMELYATLSLQIFEEDGEDRKLKEEVKNDVLICELPIMTENGTFIVNGAERVVVSQLHRSYGISFDEELQPSGRSDYKSRIIPHRGAWVEFNTEGDTLYLIIDRKKKLAATTMLRCIGFETTQEILKLFYKKSEEVSVSDLSKEFDENGVCVLIDRIIFEDVIDKDSGEVIVHANDVIDEKKLECLIENKVETVVLLSKDEDNLLIHYTLAADKSKSREDALKAIYSVTHQQQDEAPDMRTAELYFDSQFISDPHKYDLGEVGRYRLNAKIYSKPEILKVLEEQGDEFKIPSLTTMTMSKADFLAIIEYMVGLYSDTEGYTLDDIDHLGNRRTRSVGELLANQISVGLSRMSRVIRENLNLHGEDEQTTPRDLVNTRMVSSTVQSFFGSSQLSQFMDQMNPLSELTHKRRLSALGPGGLSRERAGFEVRDVHYTHYGRLCPIETPEGPNIGLINSLASFAVVNHFGFIETPYRIVGLIDFKDAKGNIVKIPEAKWHFGIFKAFVHDPHLFLELELSKKQIDSVRMNLDIKQRDLFEGFVNKVFAFKDAEGNVTYYRNGFTVDDFGGKADYEQVGTVVEQIVSDYITFLTADEEDAFKVAPASTELTDDNRFKGDMDGYVIVRDKSEYPHLMRQDSFALDDTETERIDLMDVAPMQIVSVAAGLIPFLEHDDANRALMGSNMQRQAVPLLRAEAPIVGTGLERRAALDSGTVVRAKHDGKVTFVDARNITVQRGNMVDGNFVPLTGLGEDYEFLGKDPIDNYVLRKFERSNQDSCINQKPIVDVGDFVKAGDVLADGVSTDHGELALGKNILIGFLPWNGYNYEDAVIISEELAIKDTFTSIHIEEYELEVRDTKRGPEELTREIPNVGEDALRNLDENGVIRVGAEVSADDILVGKVTPKGETELSPEERLLRAIFGEKAGDVRDSSLKAPPGMKGVVLETRIFSKKDKADKNSKEKDQETINEIRSNFQAQIDKIKASCSEHLFELLGGKAAGKVMDNETHELLIREGQTYTEQNLSVIDVTKVSPASTFVVGDDELQEKVLSLVLVARDNLDTLTRTMEKEIDKVTKGDELKPGVLKSVKVYIAKKRCLSIGDKMAGRHGNKGVVSKIVPVEDMPFTEDGRPLQILLNPLGVPSRMNIGQVLEVHLGWAAKTLGFKVSTPVFDGAKFEDICKELEKAYQKNPIVNYEMDPDNNKIIGKAKLYDGRTGEAFLNPVTIGYMYYLKLGHLVDDKIHARSIGSYALVTQQPLGGKSQFGGQRFGEMEVWAMEAYGAAYTLQELLTVKSDDVQGRSKVYDAIVHGQNTPKPGVPESFNVMIREVRSLGLNIQTNGDK
ncbi:DNA-directed RNA polymerase subunit beta [Fibrobacter sp. UWB1]|uniref:DNA-directed RNA polymerase subunit beta n=1 Tax=unclassified Fibrobacter TaxID=2634177 RepID=UPI000919DC69|nr:MULTISPECIES: DNA-directed RNA polymerase subunit beta [unclassified Fibrobacter]OWV24897.1 DNA-directed RNA polymerase subunit beta [Fibrobacter sp. UWB1]SHL53408.1 DNA-directed RNA polymerase subunit beta [Fibrobacter sp. UWOV1]